MAMDPGNATPGAPRTGLSGALMDAIEGLNPSGEFPNAQTENSVAAVLEIFATKIIEHIQNNAEVDTTVASGIVCSVDSGTHEGQTDETGAGSGTVT